MDRFGKDVADKAISTGAEPTSCVVDPLHEGLSLWAEAPIEIDGYIIRAYYYLTEEDEQNLDFLIGKRKQNLRLKKFFENKYKAGDNRSIQYQEYENFQFIRCRFSQSIQTGSKARYS